MFHSVIEQSGESVGWCVSPVYDWSDWLVWFMQLYEPLDGGGSRIRVGVFLWGLRFDFV